MTKKELIAGIQEEFRSFPEVYVDQIRDIATPGPLAQWALSEFEGLGFTDLTIRGIAFATCDLYNRRKAKSIQ